MATLIEILKSLKKKKEVKHLVDEGIKSQMVTRDEFDELKELFREMGSEIDLRVFT